MGPRDGMSYELFRQAIVDRDADAWATLHSRFRPMLIRWAGGTNAHHAHGLDCTEIADQAFARAWAALTPERFAHFPTAACLLSYLRACVRTAVIDVVRQQLSDKHALLETLVDTDCVPEQLVLDELQRTELWEIVRSTAATPAEQIVLVESYAYHLPPRVIHTRHPDLFASVADVYSVKRNLLGRLQRNRDLRRLYAEFVPA